MPQHRQLAWPNYFIAASLVIVPLYDTLTTILPVHMAETRWRYGAFGLISAAFLLPTVGFMVAFWTANFFAHRRFQRVLASVALVIVVVVLALMGLFVLDVLQVRSAFAPRAITAFKVATVSAFIKGLLLIVPMTGMAVSAFRAAKPARAGRTKRGTGIIMAGARPTPAVPVAAPVVLVDGARESDDQPVT
jgi:hypothetical protein